MATFGTTNQTKAWGEKSEFARQLRGTHKSETDPSKREPNVTMKAASTACFLWNKTNFSQSASLAIQGQVKGSPEITAGLGFGATRGANASQEYDDYNRSKVRDSRAIRDYSTGILSNCPTGGFEDCDIKAYRHALRSEPVLDFVYTYKDKNGKLQKKKYDWHPIRHILYVMVERDFNVCDNSKVPCASDVKPKIMYPD